MEGVWYTIRMTEAYLYSIISVLIVGLISFVGVFILPIHTHSGKKALTFLITFSAGALLGDVFIHLLPELAEAGQFNLTTSLYILGSIIIFFLLERFLHWHHHHEGEIGLHANHPLALLNLSADGLHNLIDGLILGAAYLVDIKLGVATTVAIVLHEIPQEIGDFGVLMYAGFTRTKALLYNFASAMTALAGVLIALALGGTLSFITPLISLAIGSFIYIAMTDLIPEIHKERKDSFLYVVTFVLGMAIMYALLIFD